MGLRSRQRRLAGVSPEDSYDLEATRHHTQSLEDHLRASIDDVSAFNLMWKNTIGYAGIALVVYEAFLACQLLVGGLVPIGTLSLSLALKLVAVGSILSSRQYVQTGRARSFGQSVLFTAAYAFVWLCSAALLGQSLSAAQASPLCVAYFVASFAVLRFIGDNTKAEVARAEQLQKLRKLYYNIQ